MGCICSTGSDDMNVYRCNKNLQKYKSTKYSHHHYIHTKPHRLRGHRLYI